MDFIFAEEWTFCERLGRVFDLENEDKFLSTVFDEETAISNEAAVPVQPHKSKKLKREVWIVNQDLVNRRKQSLAENKNVIQSHENLSEERVDPKYSCDGCMDNLLPEVLEDHNYVAQPLPCDKCKDVMKNSKPLENPKTSQYEIFPKKCLNNLCERCGDVFPTGEVFKDHLQIGSCEKSLEHHDVCIDRFAQQSSSAVIQDISNSSVLDLQCHFCGWNFNEKNELQKHLRSIHVNEMRKVLRNCFHVETKRDLESDNLIVQVLKEDMKVEVEKVNTDEMDEKADLLDLPATPAAYKEIKPEQKEVKK